MNIKKTIISSLLLLLVGSAWGQEFSFMMHFEDAEGNRDSIIIGYDTHGSRDTINSDFGEINIANTPFDSIFDVRITNQADIYGASWNYEYELFHTKKKIVGTYPYVNIDIHALHWPVTAIWDKSLFINPELNGSLITPLHDTFWWDGGWYYSDFERIVLANHEQLTFTANYPENWENFLIDEDWFCYYTDAEGKPIATYWLALGDSTMLTLDLDKLVKDKKIVLYPNPTSGIINIKGNNSIRDLFLFDHIGKRHYFEIKENTLDISNLKEGIYFLKIVYYNEKKETFKIIKTQ